MKPILSIVKLTDSQRAVVESDGNIKINAVAGSGKTTTLVEYAKARPMDKILYLGFNRSVKEEALRKFASEGIGNVRCETAHALAYGNTVRKHGYTVRQSNLKTSDVVKLLDLPMNKENLTFCYVVKEMVAGYCNSDFGTLTDYTQSEDSVDVDNKNFTKQQVIDGASQILTLMNSKKTEITHDFYLKKYHLSNPKLDQYDIILFDEGQDASPVMLDVFMNQSAKKVIVGDTHQQIYSWRGAVNSLEKVDFSMMELCESFRFNREIATVANAILDFKRQIGLPEPSKLKGLGKSKLPSGKSSFGIMARTNVALLKEAIEMMNNNPRALFYFEGNFNSYAYASDGSSLYDVLNLQNYRFENIRDAVIKTMRSMDELAEYVEDTKDAELAMMMAIVKKYGNDIFRIMRDLKDCIVDDKSKADFVFSTMHKAKGMEYDRVHLTSDFLTTTDVDDFINGISEMSQKEINEAINLLYVAVTRTRSELTMYSSCLPTELVEALGSKPDSNIIFYS